MDGHTHRPDRFDRSVLRASAMGQGIGALLDEMEHALRSMAAELRPPDDTGWQDNRPALNRARRPGFRPG